MDSRELAGIAKHAPQQLFDRSHDIRAYALRMTDVEEAIMFPTTIQWSDGKMTLVSECSYETFLTIAEMRRLDFA